MVRHRRRWRRLAVTAAILAAGVGVTATLGAALQVRHLRIEGASRFPAAEVEQALQHALGSTTLTLRAADLRALVSELPWVEDASVRVTLDGTVLCTVRERQPVAVARDGALARLVDARGRLLGEARGALPELEIAGFAPFPEERARVLEAVAEIERAWGSRLKAVERVGPADVALHFEGVGCAIVVDPCRPAQVAVARRVLEAWLQDGQPSPQRLDARIEGRVAVLPALEAPEEAS
ncbi:MAG TPA: FtsQ-type POTRA domain-containing protein [Thermoanaerobaculaceae bacterium]|nr:FtsQ-type POTRA domain-containing protein [Thermoanaerobaculaceae bacterium]HRS16343.1 FtsQ-type POTRA domain-containing protein [Thermoanaerobaculaceae bacterium]